MFGDSAAGPWMDELGDLDLPMREIGGRRAKGEPATRLRNSSVLFNDLMSLRGSVGDEKLRHGTEAVPLAMWLEAQERLEELAGRRPRGVGVLLGAEMDHTLGVARFAIEQAVWRRTGTSAIGAYRLANAIERIIDEHRWLWVARCRTGGLDDSARYYEGIGEEFVDY